MWWRAIGYTLAFLAGLLGITALVLVAFAGWQANQIVTSSGYSWSDLKSAITQSGDQSTTWPITFLILGTDVTANRSDQPVLTDTLLLVSLDQSGQVKLVSLPRDIWIEPLQTKINTLYTYAQKQSSISAQAVVSAQLEDLFGLKLDHSIVFSLDSLAALVDGLGGLALNIPVGFRDDQFPRTDVPIDLPNSQLRYKTVEFSAGPQVLSGEQTTEYIRSRHATGSAGTDNDRSRRQQEVITAIIAQLAQGQQLMEPKKLSLMLQWYHSNIEPQLPLGETIRLMRQIWPIEGLKLTNEQITVFPTDPNGLIWHPPVSSRRYQNQWVYLIRDQQLFNQQLREKLGLEVDNEK